MVSGQAEGNPAEPGHVARLWVWGQAAVAVMTALPSRDGDVLAGERLELGGQVARRPSVLQKTATGELITWGSRIRILSSLPAETRPEGLAPGGCHAGRRRVA